MTVTIRGRLPHANANRWRTRVRSLHHSRELLWVNDNHRLCAVYSYDEDAIIPCKIV